MVTRGLTIAGAKRRTSAPAPPRGSAASRNPRDRITVFMSAPYTNTINEIILAPIRQPRKKTA